MLLRPQEVRQTYRLSHTTLFALEKEGKLHPVKTPKGHRRYKTEELDALLSGEGVKERLAYTLWLQFDNHQKLPRCIHIAGLNKPNDIGARTCWGEGEQIGPDDEDKLPCLCIGKYYRRDLVQVGDTHKLDCETHPRLAQQMLNPRRDLYLKGGSEGVRVFSERFCKFRIKEDDRFDDVLVLEMHNIQKYFADSDEVPDELPMAFMGFELDESGTMIVPILYECDEREMPMLF